MHLDRNNGAWSALKVRRLNKFDDASVESIGVIYSHLDGERHDSQKVKKVRAIKQLAQVQNMFKHLAEYDDNWDNCTKVKS
jgi:hypothetical protein